ncbi:MAG TPA: response regulator [Nitrospira sp.]|nr:response regulator [Nitrospira sp.]
MSTHPSILLIDDSPGECELFRTALAQTHLDVVLYSEQDAEAAFHFLIDRAGHEPLPSIILLDWHLHKTHGHEFLKRLRADYRFTAVPVVVFTTSDDASDLSTSYAHGANGYVVKPGTFDQLVSFIAALYHFWLQWNRTPHLAESRC